MKDLSFIELNDGSCFKSLQVVDGAAGNYAVGTAITVTGKITLTPEAKQPFELTADAITVDGESAPDYPLQKKRHNVETLRGLAHLRPRTNLFSAVFRIRSVAAFAIHSFFNENGFVYVHTPIISTGDAEGAGEVFRIAPVAGAEFFGVPTGLTVSGQLNAESYALAFGKVYTFGPTFRAENSNTARHAAEFWMIEPEIAFAELSDDMALAENMLRYVLKYVMEKCADELTFLDSFVEKGLINRLQAVANAEFASITYTDAIGILEKSGKKFSYEPKWGADLQTEHERYLAEVYIKGPVFVTDYPKALKAFYMRTNDDGKTVAAMDCLVPGIGEIIGGSQREERLDLLEARMTELSMDTEEYRWYLELRKYGGCKHAGFGLGFERLLMYLTGVSNIRDVIPFPRTTGSAAF
jgi:asparaginyl-tRNA synthetase